MNWYVARFRVKEKKIDKARRKWGFGWTGSCRFIIIRKQRIIIRK